jgi:hypothetical protein
MATDTIGSLVAIVSATSAKFSADMDKVKGTLDSLAAKSESVGQRMKAGLEVAAPVLALVEAFEKLKQAVEHVFEVFEKSHQIQHLAEELGSTAHEISGLQFAGMMSGVDTETMSTALGRMVTKIGEAREGAEKTSVAFQALGINVNQLAGTTAGGQIEAIAEAMRQVKSHADRAAIAVELFGKQGRELLPFLEQGRAGIEQMMARGDELGATFGRDAGQMAAAQMAMNELKAAVDGLYISFATNLAPWVTKTTHLLTELTQTARWLAEPLRLVTDIGTERWGVTNAELDKTQRILAQGEAIRRTRMDEEGQNIIAKLKERNEWFKRYREEQARNEEEANRMSIAHAKKLVEETRHIAEEHARHAKQIADASRTPMEKFKDTIADLRQYLEMGAISFRVFEEAAGKAMDEMEKASFKHKDVSESMRSGISGADITSSSGASLAISAQRAAQDIGLHSQDIEEDQLAEQRLHTNLLQQILQAAGGRKVDLAVLEP